MHDPPPSGTYLHEGLTFGLESHYTSLGQTVRDPKGLEFKPNGVIPPVGLGPVRVAPHSRQTSLFSQCVKKQSISKKSLREIEFNKHGTFV